MIQIVFITLVLPETYFKCSCCVRVQFYLLGFVTPSEYFGYSPCTLHMPCL